MQSFKKTIFLIKAAIAIVLLSADIAVAEMPQKEVMLGDSPFGEKMTDQIRSGNYCKNTVYQRFKLVEKTNHKRLRFLGSHELLDLALEKEIMCPWSMELDLNADRRPDWVGFVKLEDQYQLLAYLSGPRDYAIEVLFQSKHAPVNLYLQWAQPDNLAKPNDKSLDRKPSRYAVKLSRLNGSADIYQWTGKKMELTHTISIQ